MVERRDREVEQGRDQRRQGNRRRSPARPAGPLHGREDQRDRRCRCADGSGANVYVIRFPLPLNC